MRGLLHDLFCSLFVVAATVCRFGFVACAVVDGCAGRASGLCGERSAVQAWALYRHQGSYFTCAPHSGQMMVAGSCGGGGVWSSTICCKSVSSNNVPSSDCSVAASSFNSSNSAVSSYVARSVERLSAIRMRSAVSSLQSNGFASMCVHPNCFAAFHVRLPAMM